MDIKLNSLIDHNFQITNAKLADASEIANLINSAYRGDYAKTGWTTESDLVDGERTSPSEIADLIQSDGSLFILVKKSGKLLGSIHTQVEPGKILYFGMLAVEPKNQAQGIGKILLNHVEKRTKELKLSFIRLHVIQLRLELIAFYERQGFVKTGNEEEFPLPHLTKVNGIKLIELKKKIERGKK